MTLPEAFRADLDRYVRALEARFGPDLVSVVLFGSWARGEGRAESDIDLLVIIRGLTGGRFERYQPVRELAREVSEELADRLSLIVSTPEGAEHVKPYYLGMLSGHVMLHDEGGFFAAVLDRLQRRLAGAGGPALRRRRWLRVLGPQAGLEAGRRGDPVTSDEMARDYLRRARARRKALDTLFASASYPDVVRESQDIAELVLESDFSATVMRAFELDESRGLAGCDLYFPLDSFGRMALRELAASSGLRPSGPHGPREGGRAGPNRKSLRVPESPVLGAPEGSETRV